MPCGSRATKRIPRRCAAKPIMRPSCPPPRTPTTRVKSRDAELDGRLLSDGAVDDETVELDMSSCLLLQGHEISIRGIEKLKNCVGLLCRRTGRYAGIAQRQHTDTACRA